MPPIPLTDEELRVTTHAADMLNPEWLKANGYLVRWFWASVRRFFGRCEFCWKSGRAHHMAPKRLLCWYHCR